MSFEPRVLSPEPVTSLQAYLDAGGRVGLDAAKAAVAKKKAA